MNRGKELATQHFGIKNGSCHGASGRPTTRSVLAATEILQGQIAWEKKREQGDSGIHLEVGGGKQAGVNEGGGEDHRSDIFII